MKFEHTMTLATFAGSLLLAGCMGPDGNPNGQPYANEPGGAIAVQPQTIGTPLYDPDAPVVPFADMRAGGAGANQPSPTGGTVPSAPPPVH
jgi:hypothetical protein